MRSAVFILLLAASVAFTVGEDSENPTDDDARQLKLKNARTGFITKEVYEDDELMDIFAEMAADRNVSEGCLAPFDDIAGKCILILNFETGSWSASRLSCEYFSGDLAKLDDFTQITNLTEYMRNYDLVHLSYWIGGSDEILPGSWIWTDGSPMWMGTPLWGTGLDLLQRPQDPDKHCALMNRYDSFYVYEETCSDETVGSICEQF